MIVLSLFDGMACGYQALKDAGIYVEKYYASEIDKYAIQIAKKNHPDIIHLGDVTKWHEWSIPKPDLIIGGSPCQGFSFAGKGLAFDDPRSKLFFDMTDIIRHYNPRFKLLENVKMKKEFLDIITDFMDCGEPHFINSALVSAQNRQRYYWYNWDAPDPVDRGIILRDIVEPTGPLLSESEIEYMNRPVKGGRNHWDFKHHSDTENPKSAAVVANFCKGVPYNVLVQQYPRGRNLGFERELEKCPTMTSFHWQQNVKIKTENDVAYRKLTPIECERLQTLPDGYTAGVSDTQRYRMLGNGWTKDVIAHLFSHLPLTDIERMMQ